MGRAEDQARIREVLIALGGSPEVLDRKEEPATLASRIEAHTRLARGAHKAPIPFAEEPAATAPSAIPIVTSTPIVTPTEAVVESEPAAQAYLARHMSTPTEAALKPVPGARVSKGSALARDRKSTRLNSSHSLPSRMPSSA